jgi:pilus assembly protein CpaF
MPFDSPGLPGMCSLHANSATDALTKLSTLPLLAGRNIDASFVVPTVDASIDLVVHAELERTGRRRVVQIVAPTGSVRDGTIEATSVFELRDGRLQATGATPARTAKFWRGGGAPAPLEATA